MPRSGLFWDLAECLPRAEGALGLQRSLGSGLCPGWLSDPQWPGAGRTPGSSRLGLVGPVLAEDADRLLEAIASLGPGGPITLNLAEVTSIDEGGLVAIRRAATMAHDIGGVLVLLLSPTEMLDQIRGSGLDEEPMILIEVLET